MGAPLLEVLSLERVRSLLRGALSSSGRSSDILRTALLRANRSDWGRRLETIESRLSASAVSVRQTHEAGHQESLHYAAWLVMA